MAFNTTIHQAVACDTLQTEPRLHTLRYKRTEPSRSGLYNWRLRRATLSAYFYRESTDTSTSLVQGGPSVRPGVDRETSYEIL